MSHTDKRTVHYVTGQSVLKNQSCDVIKMRNYPSLFMGFLFHFSSHFPNFYHVTWLIFEALCLANLLLESRFATKNLEMKNDYILNDISMFN